VVFTVMLCVAGDAPPIWYVNDTADGIVARVAAVAGVTVSETVVVWLRDPEIPVTVTVDVPAAAVLPTESVNTPLVLNDAVTPVGSPEGVKVTVPVNPFCGVTVILLVPLAACATDKLLGEADRLKSGAATALTLSVIAVVWLRLPEVPVMVTVEVPAAAVLLAESVSTPLVLNDAVTPVGSPEAVKATVPVNPFAGVTVMVLTPLVPWLIARTLGEAARVKSGVAAALTVRATVAVWVKVPEVPVMVTVEFPVAAVLLAFNVITPLELNEAVTPLGSPDAVKATVPLNPFVGVTFIVLVPLAPCVTVSELGEAERLKSAAAAGVNTYDAV
jgi:hypothetical protein